VVLPFRGLAGAWIVFVVSSQMGERIGLNGRFLRGASLEGRPSSLDRHAGVADPHT